MYSSLGPWDYLDIGSSMARYTLIHFFQLLHAQLPNQLWDSLARAMGFQGLTPHEDLEIPRREFESCNSHNEGRIGHTLVLAPLNRPLVSAAQSLLRASPPNPMRCGTGH